MELGTSSTTVLAVVVLYLVAILVEFFMPYGAWDRVSAAAQGPPTRIHLRSPGGGLRWPFVYPVKRPVDAETYARILSEFIRENGYA